MFFFRNNLDAGYCGGYEVNIVDDGLQNFEAVCLFLTAIYKILNLFCIYARIIVGLHIDKVLKVGGRSCELQLCLKWKG